MDDFFTEKQKENIKYFRDNKGFLENPLYRLKFAVIRGREIVGIFDTSEAAIEGAVANWPVGEFIIQQIESDEDVVGFLSPAIA